MQRSENRRATLLALSTLLPYCPCQANWQILFGAIAHRANGFHNCSIHNWPLRRPDRSIKESPSVKRPSLFSPLPTVDRKSHKLSKHWLTIIRHWSASTFLSLPWERLWCDLCLCMSCHLVYVKVSSNALIIDDCLLDNSFQSAHQGQIYFTADNEWRQWPINSFSSNDHTMWALQFFILAKKWVSY